MLLGLRTPTLPHLTAQMLHSLVDHNVHDSPLDQEMPTLYDDYSPEEWTGRLQVAPRRASAGDAPSQWWVTPPAPPARTNELDGPGPRGGVRFLFNIYLNADHAVHVAFVPQDFSPLQHYIARDIIQVEFEPGSHVASPSIQTWDPNAISAEFPGSEFLFTCQGPSGAVLALPHGARLEKLRNIEHVRQYAACHAESWYKYINGTRGRALTNGSLYLITGCEKSASGGMASFQNVASDADFQLSFRPTADADDNYKYRFVRGTPARTKHFDVSARSDEGTLNQTTFLHGFSISLGEGIWGRLLGVKVREITDSQLQASHRARSRFGLQGSLFSRSFDFFGGGAAGGKKYTDNTGEELTLSDFAPTSGIVNPAQLINAFLLDDRPEA
ncbi:hypothetical protein C8R46DRAFT_1224439 [Mycena filopes]|nr:hypothetical protein C8R46DRAFT_1224439 [Mycena filopes]